ncbi:MAG: hypothetical protein IJG24_01050 [Selenomonadaceae bacterium]|nr:hypothetical protein [Selenomonadaceae bacterium]
MRSVKDKLIDFVFRHESDQAQTVKDLIAATYATASRLREDCSDLAARRYRRGEHRYKTCWDMHISESQYYKLLSKFLMVARAVFDAEPVARAKVEAS